VTFQYNILRELTDAERELLTEQLGAFGAALNVPLPRVVSVGDLPVVYGDVTITFDGGLPATAYRTNNPADTVDVPGALWSAMLLDLSPDIRLPMLAIGFDESRLNPQALKRDAIEDSYGIWQVNANAWPQYPESALASYEDQAAAAQVIYNAQGYGAWYTAALNTGLYR